MAANTPSLDAKSRRLVSQIVEHFKRQGNFDELRRDCLDELDKMESFRQLNQRVESYVATFLSKQEWTDSLPKNQVRDSLRKHVNQSEALKTGVDRLISQALERKRKSFQMRIEGVVQHYIYTEKQKENQARWRGRTGKTETKQQPEKTATTTETRTSTISSVSDIISQLTGMQESSSTSKGETSSKAQTSTNIVHSKLEQNKIDRKEESGGLSHGEASKASSIHNKHSPGLIRTSKGKRIAHRTTTLTPPNVGSPSEIKEKGIKYSETTSKAKQHSIASITSVTNAGSPSEKELHVSSSPSAGKAELISTTTKEENIKTGHDKVKEEQEKSLLLKSKEDTIEPPQKEEEELERSSKGKGDHKSLSFKSKEENSHHKSVPRVKERSCSDAVEQSVDSPKGKQTDISERKQVPAKDHWYGAVVKEPNKAELLPKLNELPFKSEKGKETQETTEEEGSSSEIKEKETEVIKFKETGQEKTPEEPPADKATDLESDSDSDISDVSSVHTSDLSSFDGEVSSDSEDELHQDQEEAKTEASQEESKDSDEMVARPIRSLRRKSRELEDSEEDATPKQQSSKSQRNKSQASDVVTGKRRPGRPRKEEQKKSSMEKKQQIKQARSRARRRKEAEETNESSDAGAFQMRHRSKRKIQRKRCYSPSSESTREVCLPSKRTRTGSRD